MTAPSLSASKSAQQIDISSTTPILLQKLEQTAAEMAQLLDSLVAHFDLCVNAIKHTEGGFAAVKQAVSDKTTASGVLLPDGVTVSGVIRDAEVEANTGGDGVEDEEFSEDDRRQMLAVLANDAAEVEDVVIELHQLLGSMEEMASEIQARITVLQSEYTSTTSAFTILEGIANRLPTYLAASDIFIQSWDDHKDTIARQMEEVESMRTFYEGYLSSYNNLILEVQRRHNAEEKMKNVLRKAMESVQKLHAVDRKERDTFRRDVGDFLPADLWPGLISDAPRWEINVLGEDDGIESTPQLNKGIVEAAVKREREKERAR
jgi:autophagy-related protein 17